jgi:hypothetical protein
MLTPEHQPRHSRVRGFRFSACGPPTFGVENPMWRNCPKEGYFRDSRSMPSSLWTTSCWLRTLPAPRTLTTRTGHAGNGRSPMGHRARTRAMGARRAFKDTRRLMARPTHFTLARYRCLWNHLSQNVLTVGGTHKKPSERNASRGSSPRPIGHDRCRSRCERLSSVPPRRR